MKMINEIANDIFMITQSEKSRFVKFSVNIFVIAGIDGLIFDSGYGKKSASDFLATQIKEIETTMQNSGRECNITRVLPSHGHWDHFSGVEKLRKNLGIRVLATKRMLKNIGSKTKYRDSFRRETEIINVPASCIKKLWFKIIRYFVDEFSFRLFGVDFVKDPVEIIEENSSLVIDNKVWEVIFLPGHCDDAVALYNKDSGILLGGDNLLRTVTTWLGPPKSNLETYIDSLEYLLALPNLKLILPSHGSPIVEPHKRINEAIKHRKKRTEDILNAIADTKETGITFNTIFKKYYPATKFYEKYILRGWILTTLQYLMEKELIYSSIEGNEKVFKVLGS